MCVVIFLNRNQPASYYMLPTNSSQSRNGSKKQPALKKDLFRQYLRAKNFHYGLSKLILDVAGLIDFRH